VHGVHERGSFVTSTVAQATRHVVEVQHRAGPTDVPNSRMLSGQRAVRRERDTLPAFASIAVSETVASGDKGVHTGLHVPQHAFAIEFEAERVPERRVDRESVSIFRSSPQAPAFVHGGGARAGGSYGPGIGVQHAIEHRSLQFGRPTREQTA
jgi:hypothetical protein